MGQERVILGTKNRNMQHRDEMTCLGVGNKSGKLPCPVFMFHVEDIDNQ